jgi:alpha,alpha-trehalase
VRFTASFEPLNRAGGYLPIERHAVLGDGSGSALVAADGTIVWMCVPRFDSDPLCAALLDHQHGGRILVGPEDVIEARQEYLEDSAVLVTEQRTSDGLVRLTDALALQPEADLHRTEHHAAGCFVRMVELLDGSADVHVRLEPRGGAEFVRTAEGLSVRWDRNVGLPLLAESDRRLDGPTTVIPLAAGERLWFRLSWADPGRLGATDPAEQLRSTHRAWSEWARCIEYSGPASGTVRRSAITLKMLDHAGSGALVAAPTSSLPEAIGGVRNWDYRYVWVRDAAFSVHAFRRIGMEHEACDFLHWVLDAVEGAGRAAVLYDLDGQVPTGELEDPMLEGYRGSAPVRWGNGAADQRQHDAYGEIVDCAWQWVEAAGATITPELWRHLEPLVEKAAERWDVPDHGIWEIRAPDRLFTYSVAMCQVALDRGARLARRHGLRADLPRWEAMAEKLRERVIEDAWDEHKQGFTETLGEGGGFDASVLALPLRDVIPADHPRMIATTDAVVRHLGAGEGLIHRYDPTVSDDGLPGEEGAFLLCTSWWIDNLVLQGRLEEAGAEFERLCGRAGPLGLLPEQIDPTTDAFLGNYPQAFSHVGVLSNAVLLSRHGRAGGGA